MNLNSRVSTLAVGLLVAALPAAAQTVTFDGGVTGGWEGMQSNTSGGTTLDLTLGNAAPSLHTVLENFGISFYNTTNPAFVGDHTRNGSLTVGLDVLTKSIDFFGTEVSRDLIVEFRDYDNPPTDYPYASVWTILGTLSASPDWQHLQTTITDTASTALPSGWGGFGAEDPVTYEPILPADRSFTSVLAGTDELVFSTYVPGWSYGYSVFDVAVDNISISAVPEPQSWALMALGLVASVSLARRCRRPSAV